MDRKRIMELLLSNGKHGNYLALPEILKEPLGISYNPQRNHYEIARLRFILEHLGVSGKSVLDIGANTGFFSFEMLGAGANHVTAYEGNAEHSKFIADIAAELGLSARLKIKNYYFDFDHDLCRRYDITLLLNVLHHVGDDYGACFNSIEAAKNEILRQANSISSISKYMVFQMGFNWKGNPDLPFFHHGTKKEMIFYIEDGVRSQWDVIGIGIGCRDINGNVYFDVINDSNIERDNSLAGGGEFLNRPLFILRSKQQR
jgi:SAM-dependent methyltransferase